MVYNNISENKQLGFQEESTIIMIGIKELHDKIMYYMIIIMTIVLYMSLTLINKYKNKQIINKYITHSTIIEILWTIIPTIILIIIIIPSFKLLYSIEEIIKPLITLKIIGNQWYWNYSITDYEPLLINFDSYLIPESDIEEGQPRLLNVDNIVYLPILTPIRFLISSDDVIHSFSIPSLGVKLDAIPGRINQINVYILKEGLYLGQCTELCGIQHAYMPIAIKGVNNTQYLSWLLSFNSIHWNQFLNLFYTFNSFLI